MIAMANSMKGICVLMTKSAYRANVGNPARGMNALMMARDVIEQTRSASSSATVWPVPVLPSAIPKQVYVVMPVWG